MQEYKVGFIYVKEKVHGPSGQRVKHTKKGNRAKGNDIRDKERSSAVMMRKRSKTCVKK